MTYEDARARIYHELDLVYRRLHPIDRPLTPEQARIWRAIKEVFEPEQHTQPKEREGATHAQTVKRTGVVAELNGQYWGIEYEDAQCRSFGFGSLASAYIADPKSCKQATDMTYSGSPDFARLASARLVPVTVTTVYAAEGDSDVNR